MSCSISGYRKHNYFELLIKYKLPMKLIINNLAGEEVNGYYFSVKNILEYCVPENTSIKFIEENVL